VGDEVMARGGVKERTGYLGKELAKNTRRHPSRERMVMASLCQQGAESVRSQQRSDTMKRVLLGDCVALPPGKEA
jgi:hypothetical protein